MSVEPERRGWLDKLRGGLRKTSTSITQGTNYYIGIACNFTGTQPKFLGQTSTVTSTNISLINSTNYLSCFQTGQTSWASFTPSSATKYADLFLVYAR